MTLTFLLPSSGHVPVGGFKVVYEYANRLSRLGYDVQVVHAPDVSTDTSVGRRFKRSLRYIQRRLDGSYRPDGWFRLDPSVRLDWAPSLRECYIPPADFIVATAWQTAEYVANYGPDKGRKLYLVQSLETWSGPEERVLATWKKPLKKVVIARWLAEIAEDMGEEAIYIPNGLDFRSFGVDTAPEQRNPLQLLMLYHTLELKGSDDGLAALRQLKSEVPQLMATMFGVSAPPADLPSWIMYRRNPAQSELRRLYNECSIFLAPSHVEGWPLPPAEAMMSGAALVATEIGGHREYAFHERTALLSPPGEPHALAANARRLISDCNLRLQLVREGRSYIQNFTWDRAVRRFDEVLSQKGRSHDEP